MTTLGDVLEAIHGTDRAYRTVRAVGRSDGEVWHLWAVHPGRERVERAEPFEFKVQVGSRWWEYSAQQDGWTNHGEAPTFVIEWPLERFLDPRPLLGGVITVIGDAEHAGRSAVTLQVRKRADDDDQDDNGLADWFDAYGEEFEAVIDLVTGVVLRAGNDELIDVHFDEQLDVQLFELPADPDREVTRPVSPRPRVVATLAEAAAPAPFLLLAPAVLPAGAETGSYILAPDGQPPWVAFGYGVGPGPRATVQISQHPDRGDEDDPSRPWQPAGIDGVWVRDGPGFMTDVLVRRFGTTAVVQTDLGAAAAIEIGASMGRA